MIRKAAALIAGTIVGALLAGCKIEVPVPIGGHVTTKSGSFTCYAKQTCLIEASDLTFDETFIAVPDAGMKFLHWKSRERGFFGGSSNETVRLYTSGFAGNENLLAILRSEKVFYLEPVFTKAESQSEQLANTYRFLNQATMGATLEAAQRLAQGKGGNSDLEAWIDAQVKLPSSLIIPFMIEGILAPGFVSSHKEAPGYHPDFVYNDDKMLYRLYGWMDNALYGEDQLRQRVAWALSQIFVVSDRDALLEQVESVAEFYDTLSRNAFSNYRELLEAVTLHPAMGVYLSMLGNQRAVKGTTLRPDENYAREVLQLFSIGQSMLNDDGSVRVDATGQPIPAYNQEVISGFARAFTGWSYECTPWPCERIEEANVDIADNVAELRGWGKEYISGLARPMAYYPEAHEPGEKQLLNYPNASRAEGLVPAGLGGKQDLKEALDNIFYHPNVAPFFSRLLIQKLVSSNPSPEYIARVGDVFKDNGQGVRGDLLAVVKAILLDDEARKPVASVTTGKLKEPLLKVLHLWRAYDAFVPNGKTTTRSFCCPVWGDSPLHIFGQSPGQAMSVFNFFSPDYVLPGGLFDGGLVGPELQIATENLHIQMGWFFHVQSTSRTSANVGSQGDDTFYIRIDDELALAHDNELLVNHIARKLLGSEALVSPVTRAEIYNMLEQWPSVIKGSAEENTWRQARVSEALFMFLLSPDFAVQR